MIAMKTTTVLSPLLATRQSEGCFTGRKSVSSAPSSGEDFTYLYKLRLNKLAAHHWVAVTLYSYCVLLRQNRSACRPLVTEGRYCSNDCSTSAGLEWMVVSDWPESVRIRFFFFIYRKIKRKKEGSLCDSDKLNSALKGGWKIHPHADVTLHVGIFFLDYC